jgi:two-component system chemotaxis response regulator CheB
MPSVIVKKRVLLADDAVVVRKVLSQAIEQDPDLEVAATAVNGRIALAKFEAARPDIVLLDIEMPEMDGLETVRELRKIDTRVPIIMFSTLTERGASITLEALALGATDYVAKPSNVNGIATLGTITGELLPKIRALCRLRDRRVGPSETKLPKPTAISTHSRLLLPPQIVVIGVSTGGPDALARLLPTLPRDFSVPLLIAQHMPPIFTSMLAARLTAKAAFPVRECASGERVAAGCALIAPGDFHMVVQQDHGTIRIATNQGPRENFCRPSVDVLFRSVAALYGARTLAIILTGMGQDGLRGCEELRAQGARIYVQDEASSVVWGMPGFVARAGLADKVLPLQQIGPEIMSTTRLKVAERVLG